MTKIATLKKNFKIFRIFCFNNSDTRKIKDLQKYSNKEIRVTLQSDNTKHKPSQFIPCSNFIEGFQNLSLVLGAILSWLVYKVFWWLYFSLAVNLSIFLSVKSCNVYKRQFTKYLLSQTVKNKISLIHILYPITSCFENYPILVN